MRKKPEHESEGWGRPESRFNLASFSSRLIMNAAKRLSNRYASYSKNLTAAAN
jgi:hypothetical protein